MDNIIMGDYSDFSVKKYKPLNVVKKNGKTINMYRAKIEHMIEHEPDLQCQTIPMSCEYHKNDFTYIEFLCVECKEGIIVGETEYEEYMIKELTNDYFNLMFRHYKPFSEAFKTTI